ncbi:hypothetical protein PG987_006252 [Apiospora arundinis]
MHLFKSLLATLGLILITTAFPLQAHSNSSILELSRRARIGGGHGAAEDTGSITDLFLLQDGKSSCLDRKDTLDHWLREARDLHQAMVWAYADAPTDPFTMMTFAAYFALEIQPVWQPDGSPIIRPNPERWANIGGHIDRVSAFLSGSGVASPQVPGEKPRLFCGPDAFEYQPWGSTVRDRYGKQVMLDEDNHLTIDEAFPVMKDRGISIFWVDAFNGYDFSQKTATTICPPPDDEENIVLARTSKHPVDTKPSEKFEMGQTNRHMVFCPLAFDPASNQAHSYESLAKAISPEGYPTPPTDENDERFVIDRMMPFGATMYHELYHLVDRGNRDTEDLEYNIKNIILAAAKGEFPIDSVTKLPKTPIIPMDDWRRRNVNNPQTYTFLAMSFYLRYNAPQGKDPVIYTGSKPQKYEARWGPHPH